MSRVPAGFRMSRERLAQLVAEAPGYTAYEIGLVCAWERLTSLEQALREVEKCVEGNASPERLREIAREALSATGEDAE